MKTANKMKKGTQKFILILLVFILIFAPNVFAQNEEDLVCQEPISIGSSLDATLEAMKVLFLESQNIHREIATQIETANAALAAIGKDASNCDTSTKECKAMCPSIETKITFKVTFLWGFDLLKYPFCLALCSRDRACRGKPCPSLDTQLTTMTTSLENLETSIQKINDVFTSSTERMEEDIIKEEEVAEIKNCLGITPFIIDPDTDWKTLREEVKNCLLDFGVKELAITKYVECENKPKPEPEDCRWFLYAGLKLNKIEFAQRKLDITRADFHRWRMSADDWGKVYRGEIVPRKAVKCLDALEAKSYWPKWWTEDCQEYCKKDPYSVDCQDCLCTGCESTWGNDRCTDAFGTDNNPIECQECLNQSPIHQYSWTKATGCKFYGACQIECKDLSALESKVECLDCLCAGIPPAEECEKRGGTAEECKWEGCQKWICGESMLNWTGCHTY